MTAEPDCETGFLRWNSCRYVEWGYNVWEVVNGVPTKRIGYQTYLFSTEVGWNHLSLNWSLRSTISVLDAWGTEAVGAQGVVSNGCARDPLVCTDNGGSCSVFLEKGHSYFQDWEQWETGPVSQGAGSSSSLGGYIGAWLVVSSTGAPGSSISLNIAEVNGVKGRCDRVVRTTPGCVASENPAVITYDSVAYPKVAEVAEHVYDAQASLPYNWGWYGVGSPLTLGDGATETANRAVSCPPGGTPTGKSCDEYPIAKSNEGAASGYAYSVRYVAPEANSSQGGLTSAYIGYSRIMLNEEFWVLAILPDGRNSWDR
ncbi:NucA/NucB deoxyribonuclease domain-containing protein [Saccharomonospora viridis]|uniref:NucA/NucB deoxyribonuclease domain-containing protein n=1 Tax=Saccharomonospora viridis TaxID=1852 RepID=UPI00145EA54C